MARGYGTSDYGQSLYGATLYLDGVATVSASATNTATCNRVRLADSAISGSSSVSSPTGEFLVDASANTIQGTSSVASGAVEVFDGLASGGGSAAGSTASGLVVREASATSSASASNSASLQFLTNAEASTSAAATVAIDYERVQSTSSAIAGQSLVLGRATYSIGVSVLIEASTTINDVDYIRERSVSANAIQGVSAFASTNGREKWEGTGSDVQSWGEISTDTQSWDTISQTSITWSEIAA